LEQFFNKSFSVCDIEIIEFEKGFEMDVTFFVTVCLLVIYEVRRFYRS